MFIEYNNKQKINKKWINDKNKNKYMTIYNKSDRILKISRIMSKTKFKIFITSPPCLEHPNTQAPNQPNPTKWIHYNVVKIVVRFHFITSFNIPKLHDFDFELLAYKDCVKDTCTCVPGTHVQVSFILSLQAKQFISSYVFLEITFSKIYFFKSMVTSKR